MKSSHYWKFLVIVLLAILVSVPYLRIAFSTAEGRPVAPLDDAYITLQYARQMARGHFYCYNSSDPPTTGMTSPLFGALMAGCYLIGFTGEGLVALAVSLGLVWMVLAAWLTHNLVLHLLEGVERARVWAFVAALLLVFTGSVQWSFFNGMETGLFTVVTLAALNAFLGKHPLRCALWAGIAGLVRPEGLILTAILWSISFLDVRRDPSRWRKWLIPLSIAVLVGLLPSGLNWLLTGTPSATGFQAKTWTSNVPAYPREIMRSIALSYRDVLLGHFLGWKVSFEHFALPGLLIFGLLGWLAMGSAHRWWGLLSTSLWFFGGTLANALLITATWHVGRYQVPLMPIILGVAVTGIGLGWQWASQRWQMGALVALLLYLLGATLWSLPDFVDLYRLSVRTMVNQQLVLADWLRSNLPEDARVGVHDVGSLRYVGRRPTYDLVGLTTPKAAPAWRHGSGSVYELMENSPMRPDYFAIYPDAFSVPYLANTDLFEEELLLVDVPYAHIASAEPVQGIWKANWQLANSGDRIYQADILSRTAGLTLVDSLDVADLDDEEDHNLSWWQSILRPGFPTEVHQMSYRTAPEVEVLDGGRLINGGLEFMSATEPGRPLWIVARLHAYQGGAVYVKVDGQSVGRWAYPHVPGEWLETLFYVPGTAITTDHTHVSLEVDPETPGLLHFAPYYFWILQGEAQLPVPEISRPLDSVRFCESIRLLGFDLSEEARSPGDPLPLTLYWETTSALSLDVKVFVHLYDEQGNVVAQSDSRPYYGTRPPYTWLPGEIVVDPRAVLIPAETLPGIYSLGVGLYYPDGSARCVAYHDSVPLADDTLILATLQVE